MINKKDIFKRLILIAETYGLSGEKLRKIIGTPRSPITFWKQNQKMPTLIQLAKICEKTNVSADYILFGKGKLELVPFISIPSEFEELSIFQKNEIVNLILKYNAENKQIEAENNLIE